MKNKNVNFYIFDIKLNFDESPQKNTKTWPETGHKNPSKAFYTWNWQGRVILELGRANLKGSGSGTS